MGNGAPLDFLLIHMRVYVLCVAPTALLAETPFWFLQA